MREFQRIAVESVEPGKLAKSLAQPGLPTGDTSPTHLKCFCGTLSFSRNQPKLGSASSEIVTEREFLYQADQPQSEDWFASLVGADLRT